MKQSPNIISIFLFSLPLVCVTFYAVVVIYFPTAYVIGTYEDLYGEWGQTYGFLTTCVFSTLIAFNKNHPQRRFFILLAAASFYVFMEEISWGQRLIGFETPNFFHDNSYQDEANIHNLLTGPVDAWTKTLLTYFVALGLFTYGVLFPLALRMNFKPALYLARWKIAAAPPLALIPAFFFASILELELFSFNEAEVAELLVAWGLAYTAFDSWLQNRALKSNSVTPYFVVLVSAVALTWTTTSVLLNNSEQHSEINHRLANGYKKFADRYEGYDYTYGVVTMLQRYDELDPNNTVILRQIADNLEMMGETEQAALYLEKAINESLQRVKSNNDDIPANVSLAKSYRKLHDYKNMVIYANKAYQLAVAKQQAEPDNAYWAYWLAKACEQTNRREDAFKYYRMAHQLDPNSSRYEEAYLQMKEIMIEYED